MTRYIDADALKKDISEWCYVIGKPHLLGRDEVMIVIDGSVTADVVEVVRCVECKHRIDDEDFVSGHYCVKRPSNGGYFCDDDDFCSYGERRKEDSASF